MHVVLRQKAKEQTEYCFLAAERHKVPHYCEVGAGSHRASAETACERVAKCFLR